MTTATATATPAKIHVEVPGFTGFGEFHGSHIDCSADAELMARHPLDGTPLDAAHLNLWWNEYWNTGHHTSHGARLSDIYWHLTGSAHKLDPRKCRVARYIRVDAVSQATLHQALKEALVRGQTVIVYLNNASAGLAYNERGVQGHFVALGGIDSDKGYLVGNGDDVNALGGHGIIPARWYGWASLAKAEINGMIALEKVEGRTMAGVPQGWKDDGTTLVAPNNVPVVRGFRAFVLTNNWQPENTPRAAEYIDTGTGHSRQDFRFSSLGWVNNKAELLPIGDELANAKAEIASLKQQLTNAPQPDPLAAKALAVAGDLASLLKDVG